ncbi:hypothetical protein ACHAO9_001506 [Fusarium lateritium]
MRCERCYKSMKKSRKVGPLPCVLRSPLTSIAQKLRDLRAWIGSPPPNDLYHDSNEKRLEETCEWIFHRNKFLEWQAPATTAKVLWIKGPAGFGKTILCAKLVQAIEETATAPMAYFFLSTNFEDRDNPFLAMRSWLISLVLKSPVAFDIVSKRRLSQHEQRAPQSTIVQLFREVTMAIPGCTFILDGLDECTGMVDTDTKSVTHFLKELRNAVLDTNTRLLILSRPAAVIQQGLSLFPGYSVYNIELDDVGPDLATFASDVVKRKLAKEDEEWKLSIAQKMKSRCEGQFQWIKLQESSLRKGLGRRSLERVIDETPPGLDALYDREWNRINSMGDTDRQRALSLLRWVAFAMGPLTVGEVAEAVLITEDSQELPVDDFPERIDEDYIESMILGLCGSLLEVKQPAIYRSLRDTTYSDSNDIAETNHNEDVRFGVPPRDKKVHLTHFSVKEYTSFRLSPMGGSLGNEKLRSFVESQEHMALAKCCVRYIILKSVWDESPEQQNKHYNARFLYYAATKWHHHYKLVARPDSDLNEEIWALFDKRKPIWPTWSRYLLGDPSSTITDGEWKAYGAIHVAASMNLTHVVARLLQDGNSDPNYRLQNGDTALHQACFHGCKEVAAQLLENGAELDAVNMSGDTALHLASMFDHGEMVAILIERGANVHAKAYLDQTPLHYASSTGHIHVARLLLDAGADPRSKSAHGYTPIVAATIGNHISMVQLLLDRGADQGADINTAADELSRALCEACEEGFLELIKLLVNRGADIKSRTTGGRKLTPLYSAILGGHLEAVSFLLDQGCSTEEVYVAQGKPLHYASVSEHSHIAKLLLQRGANIEARDNCGRQPIHLAAYAGRAGTVKLLVEKGADTKSRDYNGRTPISHASESGRMSVVQLLLTTYSDDLRVTDYYRRSPLHYACQGGRGDVVRLFIQSKDVKALLDRRDAWGSTPLSMAVRRGHEDVVIALMATKLVDLKSKDDLGRSLAWWASRQQQPSILLRRILPNEDSAFGRDEDSCAKEPETWGTYCDL